MAAKLKIRRGDRVIVRTGKNKGRVGEVLKVIPKENRVVVQGVNIVKRHRGARPNLPGGIDEREAPIHVSNVGIVDPQSNKATRVGFKTLADGSKVRVAKRSGEVIAEKERA
ncbi:MAG: 50S ribosomal protein L24 [Alphaproteobacteria bacterium]|nr:50S ribosomal protein L24 [Alphaproteobacteria bacterium]